MKLTKITIGGVEYPSRLTMGAMLGFKQRTGKDISKMDGEMSEVAVLLYCSVESACRVDKVEFNYSLEEFADRLDLAQLAEFNDGLTREPKKK